MEPIAKKTKICVFEVFHVLHSPYCYYYCFYFFLFFYFFFAFRRRKIRRRWEESVSWRTARAFCHFLAAQQESDQMRKCKHSG